MPLIFEKRVLLHRSVLSLYQPILSCLSNEEYRSPLGEDIASSVSLTYKQYCSLSVFPQPLAGGRGNNSHSRSNSLYRMFGILMGLLSARVSNYPRANEGQG